MKIPVTVFTGFLGSGKTTIIMNLLKQLPKDYNLVWLKNEYGDVNIDAELAKESNVKTSQILNGCICCVLVGKIGDALNEIVDQYNPDRIIIETAGTAYPYSITLEINKLYFLETDGVIDVIDAVNFSGYKDKSAFALSQSQYTNLVVINKTGGLTEDELDQKLDDVYERYPDVEKVKTKDGFVPKDLLIGLDTKQLKESGEAEIGAHCEIDNEVDTFSFIDANSTFDLGKLEQYLAGLKNYNFIRIKGIVKAADGFYVLNYVFGNTTFEKLENYQGETKIVFMGEEIKSFEEKIKGEMQSNKI